MIIDTTYFKGDIYIPHAKPGISNPATGVSVDVIDFINQYASECLFDCLGPQLYEDLKLNLDSNETSWVDALADAKWDELVNGKTYTDPNSGLEIIWRGIRYISDFEGSTYDKSFLANYVYFFYEKKEYITRSGTGHEKENAHNAETVTPTHKVVNSWNKFVSLVQGDEAPELLYGEYIGYGIDHYVGGSKVSLYKFINDSNEIAENTYANFNPKTWRKMNQFNV